MKRLKLHGGELAGYEIILSERDLQEILDTDAERMEMHFIDGREGSLFYAKPRAEKQLADEKILKGKA